MIVSNSSPLIYLTRIGALNLLHQLFGEVLIPEGVKIEVVDRGLEVKAPDALAIKEILEKADWLRVKKLTAAQKSAAKVLSENTLIDMTDGEAIILARDTRSPLLVDDREAVALCELEGVKTVGTLGVIMQAVKKKVLRKKDARKLIDALIDRGFYLGVEVYREAMRMLSG
jgi:predicted nucleic acid-binding protein